MLSDASTKGKIRVLYCIGAFDLGLLELVKVRLDGGVSVYALTCNARHELRLSGFWGEKKEKKKS